MSEQNSNTTGRGRKPWIGTVKDLIITNPILVGEQQFRIRLYQATEEGKDPSCPKLQIQGQHWGKFTEWSPAVGKGPSITDVFSALLDDLTMLEEIHKEEIEAWQKKFGDAPKKGKEAKDETSALAAYQALLLAKRAAKPPEQIATPPQNVQPAQARQGRGRGGR